MSWETDLVINKAHMHALTSLLNDNNNITTLRTFHDIIENYVHGLSALGQSTESYGALLVLMVLRKLPADVQKNLGREHSNLEWTFDQWRHSCKRDLSPWSWFLCSTTTTTIPLLPFTQWPQADLNKENHWSVYFGRELPMWCYPRPV